MGIPPRKLTGQVCKDVTQAIQKHFIDFPEINLIHYASCMRNFKTAEYISLYKKKLFGWQLSQMGAWTEAQQHSFTSDSRQV